MFNAEEKFINLIEKHKNTAFFIIINIIAIIVRYAGKDFLTGDMLLLQSWYDSIKSNGGLKGLAVQTGDYNLLYQTIIAFFTYIAGESIYMYKTLSIIFDFALAFLCGYIVTDIYSSSEDNDGVNGVNSIAKLIAQGKFNFVYTVVLFMPTVVLNSAYWGQCDSIYVVFALAAIYFLYKEKYIWGFIMLGISLSFKFQVIFILPVIIFYYFYKKNFSLLYFLITIVTFWCSGIIAYINGRGLFDAFTIYASQTGTYERMWLNVTSFWILVGYSYSNLKTYAIYITMVILGLGLLAVMSKKYEIDSFEKLLNLVCWSVWTCILFLPAMHERYTYMLDIGLIILSFINIKYLKYAFCSIVLSIITYGSYMFGNGEVDKWHVILFLATYIYYSWSLYIGTQNTHSKC